jgi:uncharacterized repeat protein (TIGR01451 family)
MPFDVIAFAATKTDLENRGLAPADSGPIAAVASMLGNPAMSLFVGRAMADRKAEQTPTATEELPPIVLVPPRPAEPDMEISNEDGSRNEEGAFNTSKEVFRVGDGGATRERELIYQVIIKNRSTVQPATNVRVEDAMAPNTGIITFQEVISGFPTRGAVSGTGPTGFIWNIGTLNPGEAAEIQFRAEALKTGNDINRVILTADQLSGPRRDEETTVVQSTGP